MTTIVTGIGTLFAAGQQPDFVDTTARVSRPDAAVLVAAGAAPSLLVSIGNAIVVIAGLAPTFVNTTARYISPQVGSVVAAGQPPTTRLSIDAGSVIAAGFAPIVLDSGRRVAEPGLAQIAVTGLEPLMLDTGARYAQPANATVAVSALAPVFRVTGAYVLTLDQILASQADKDVTFNEIAAALSAGAIFGIRASKSGRLNLTLYGGAFPAQSGIVTLSDQSIKLTPSATNYVFADVDGVVAYTTTAPTGWPGPMPSGARALYQLAVGADSITSGTCYAVKGPSGKGVQGQQGATGVPGDELWVQRKRVWNPAGSGSLFPATSTNLGFSMTNTSAGNTRTVDPSTFVQSIPCVFLGAGGGVGQSNSLYSNLFCFRGNAAGRGGFDVTHRWGIDTTYSAGTDMRSFVGLYDTGGGVFGDADPNTHVNLVGVGANHGDANLSVIYNDGSGTATMTGLGSSFPARAANAVYELRLQCAQQGSSIDYTLTRVDTGAVASGSLTTDIPSDTTFLATYVWVNNGSQSGSVGFNMMQIAANSRY